MNILHKFITQRYPNQVEKAIFLQEVFWYPIIFVFIWFFWRNWVPKNLWWKNCLTNLLSTVEHPTDCKYSVPSVPHSTNPAALLTHKRTTALHQPRSTAHPQTHHRTPPTPQHCSHTSFDLTFQAIRYMALNILTIIALAPFPGMGHQMGY